MADLSGEILARLPGVPVFSRATVKEPVPLTVLIDGAERLAIPPHGLDLASGDQVLAVTQGGTCWVLHALSRVERDVVTEPTATAVVESRWEPAMIDARCTEARTARGGSWRTDSPASYRAIQGFWSAGSPNTGYFFYGGSLRGEGSVTAARIELVRPRAGGSSGPVRFNLRLHGAESPGSSPPALQDGSVIAPISWGERVTVDIGTSWGQKLLNGEASGVAIASSGSSDYGILLGPAEAQLAGRIIIEYMRKA